MNAKEVIHLNTIMAAYFHRSLMDLTLYVFGENKEPKELVMKTKGYSSRDPQILIIPEGYCKEALPTYLDANDVEYILSKKNLASDGFIFVTILLPKEEGCAPENPYFIYKK